MHWLWKELCVHDFEWLCLVRDHPYSTYTKHILVFSIPPLHTSYIRKTSTIQPAQCIHSIWMDLNVHWDKFFVHIASCGWRCFILLIWYQRTLFSFFLRIAAICLSIVCSDLSVPYLVWSRSLSLSLWLWCYRSVLVLIDDCTIAVFLFRMQLIAWTVWFV